MSSAPIYAMVLEKPGAIRAWRALAGPTNSATARESAPGSLRAQFGTDGSQNAVHGSDSAASAAREIAVVFGGRDTSGGAPAAAVERTLALIKPDAYPAHKEEILELVAAAGFHVVEQAEVRFDRAKAEEFYKEHEDKAFYETLTAWMSSTKPIPDQTDQSVQYGSVQNTGPTNFGTEPEYGYEYFLRHTDSIVQ
ncbi:Thioredoxin domain-containing protein 3 [Cladochytrium tenue]|nr:Thioredoxin domain-containing protein 3 [Cladochytrium tenue]